MAESLSRCLQYIYPRYLIGLSATPYRPDGLNDLLTIYFGNYKIVRKLYCPHSVYRVNTGFTPKVEKTTEDCIIGNSRHCEVFVETTSYNFPIVLLINFVLLNFT